MNTDAFLIEKSFTQFNPKSRWSAICCYKQHIHISRQSVKALNIMAHNHRLDGRTSRTSVRPNEVTLKHQTEEKKWQINKDLEMSNLLNFILTAYIKNIEHHNNQINHENLRNYCMARGSDNFVFKIICQRYNILQ
jgi:hypothetical protein